MKDFIKTLNGIIVLTSMALIGWKSAALGNGESLGMQALLILIAMVNLYIVYILHTLLHEGGHLLGGLATGYTFVSFRIYSLAIIKNKQGKFERKQLKIMGTAGQCLMCPPKVPIEKMPYKIYNLMGGLMNLYLGGIALFITFFLPASVWRFYLCEEFGIIGLMVGLVNLIPSPNSSLSNDGTNVYYMGRDTFARKCFQMTLTINAYLSLVDSYDELPASITDELKSIDFKQMDLKNSIIMSTFNYQTALFFLDRNFEKTYDSYLFIEANAVEHSLVINEAKCELLFLDLLRGAPREVINQRYTPELQKYIQVMGSHSSIQRLMYTYNKLYLRDEEKAKTCMRKLEELVNTSPIKADAKMELEIARDVMRQANAEV